MTIEERARKIREILDDPWGKGIAGDVIEHLIDFVEAELRAVRGEAFDEFKSDKGSVTLVSIAIKYGLLKAAEIAEEWIWIDEGVPMPIHNDFRKALAKHIRKEAGE